MGAVGRKVKTKRLMVVTPEGYELVHTIEDLGYYRLLHAKYKHYKDKIYDSSRPRLPGEPLQTNLI
jgi:hypothetical protein